uniref:Cathepsin propeptide inhibitor domain-containing protein n=1 Tax=Arion vulgaris TaxID=1028688 RepID=A0A0B6Z530_9EUPU
MKTTDLGFLLATIMVLVLILMNVQAAPANSDPDSYIDEQGNQKVVDWLLSHFADYRRDRRTQMDAGFLSRHSALKNFLNSYDAGIEAADPHGPGRRK